jgi:hypothetical protein
MAKVAGIPARWATQLAILVNSFSIMQIPQETAQARDLLSNKLSPHPVPGDRIFVLARGHNRIHVKGAGA